MLERYKKIIIVLVISALPVITYGQGGSNSPYSMLGIGDLTGNGFGRNKAMGSVMSPLISPYQLNTENPASYSAIFPNSFIFEFGMNTKYYQLQGANNEFSDLSGNISYIAAGFPITKWWKAGVGLKPISKINYSLEDLQKIDSEQSLLNLYTGKGGINNLFFDNSFIVTKNISLGIKFAYVFGVLDKDRTIVSGNVKGGKSTSVIQEKNHSAFDAVAFGFGAHYHKSINENLMLNLGATYNLKTELSGEHDRLTTTRINKTSGLSLPDTIVDENVNRGVLELPQSYSAGASIILKQKLELAVDYRFENWSDTKMFGESRNLNNNEQFSFGVEFSPDYNSTKYWKLIKYRAGFNMSNSYLTVQDKQLKEIGASIGFAFPLRSLAIINISGSYSRRYVPGLDILKEDIFQIHLNLSFRGTWFIKSKFY